MDKQQFSITRRRFLARAALTLGGASCLSTQGRLSMMQAAFAASGNYSALPDHKSLVCVFLFGGNDSFNMFVPYELGQYNKYASVRQGLSLPRTQLLPVTGNAWSFHPSAPELRTLYNEGALGLVANVGSLFAPLTVADYQANAVNALIPPELFSHSDQTELWQTNRPAAPGVLREGWGGLTADLLVAANTNRQVPLSFSTNGENLWQVGVSTGPYGIRPEQGIPKFEAFNSDSYPYNELSRSAAFRSILLQPRGNALVQHAATSMSDTIRQADLLRDTLNAAPMLQTPFDTNDQLALQLHTVARLIAVRQSLGMKRQLFFVGIGGFDTHSAQLGTQGSLMRDLSSALHSFYRATQELGVANSVTTFTTSEFGRTLTTNGDGTDHAWAADSLVLGGAVRGATVHGTPIEYSATPVIPPYSDPLFGPADVGAGRFIPNWSVDQYGATLARWMGVIEPDLLTIFPNLNRFTTRDLGFMQPG